MRSRSTSQQRQPGAFAREQGMSLVEVLVALVLLGIILSAAASSLIQFSRTATDNERRVQATALMNRLHEELQALPWRDAVVYEDELAALLPPANPEDADPEDVFLEGLDDSPTWTFEGGELVTAPTPSGDKRDAVPTVHETMTIDDREYDVIRLVTWSEQDPSIKRFTTIVQWRLYNRVYEERFFSERAPTGTEAGDPERPRVVQFQVGPSPMVLEDAGPDDVGENPEDILITVRFSEPVDSADVTFHSVDDPAADPYELTEESLPLTPYINGPEGSGKFIAFRGVIDAESHSFPVGTRTFTAIGYLGSEEFTGTTTMTFEGDQEDAEDAETDLYPELGEVRITSLTVSRSMVCHDANDRFRDEVVVEALIDGLMPDAYSVSVTYSAGGSPGSESIQPVASETFNGTNALFRLTLAAGKDHGFEPVGQNNNQAKDETDFRVTATRPGSGSIAVRDSATLTVRHHEGNHCK